MNKWIYSSVTLNFFSLVSLVILFIYLKPIIRILSIGGSAAGDCIGLGYFPLSIAFTIVLCICYIVEIILYILIKKYSFLFPYNKIKFKFLYYILFYTGLFFGCGIVIFMLVYLCKDFYDTVCFFLNQK